MLLLSCARVRKGCPSGRAHKSKSMSSNNAKRDKNEFHSGTRDETRIFFFYLDFSHGRTVCFTEDGVTAVRLFGYDILVSVAVAYILGGDLG